MGAYIRVGVCVCVCDGSAILWLSLALVHVRVLAEKRRHSNWLIQGCLQSCGQCLGKWARIGQNPVTRKKREPIQQWPKGACGRRGYRTSERVFKWRRLLTGTVICTRATQSVLSDLAGGEGSQENKSLSPTLLCPWIYSTAKTNRSCNVGMSSIMVTSPSTQQGWTGWRVGRERLRRNMQYRSISNVLCSARHWVGGGSSPVQSLKGHHRDSACLWTTLTWVDPRIT